MKKSTSSKDVDRVLHLVPGFHFGGIESLLMSLYRGLDKEVLQFDFMVDTCDKLPEFDEIRAAGGRVFQMGRYLDSPIKYHLKLNKILKDYGHEYTALHSHTVIRAFPVLLAAWQHDINQRILHSHTDSLEGSKIASFIAKVTCLLATDFLACSENAGRLYFKNKAYKVFSNTIRTQNFEFNINDRGRIRKLIGIKENNFVIGHTGRFTYPKNHEQIIRVFAEVYRQQSDARLLLVGEGPLKSEMKDLVANLGLSDVVIFAGLQANVAPYLSSMDVFFLPSHFEGFCISLLEAQANGLPCLASDVIPSEVKITPCIITCDINSSLEKYASKLIQLHKIGRADSTDNIAIIRRSGYDSDFQQSDILAMYSVYQT